MKTITPDRSQTRKPDTSSRVVPQTWEDFSRLYPIYEALTRQLDLVGGPYPSGTKISSWSDKKSRDRDLLWLDQVDRQVQAVHLRHFLVTPAVAREDGLRLFLQRHLSKPEKLPADRDKIDLLLVQYFVLCAPQDLIAGRYRKRGRREYPCSPSSAKWRQNLHMAANRSIAYWKPHNNAAVCATSWNRVYWSKASW